MTVPTIVNIFKPTRITSYDVLKKFKRAHPKKSLSKVGHFGTLDPFACGVLLVGINGAAKLNNFIHDYLPKSYLAIGKLGVHTETGDLTIEPSQIDDSRYVREVISSFSKEFINEHIQKFVGEYMQSPHVYSAAKFEGRPLHQWAREGQEIKKAPVKRFIHSLEVVKYSFPYLVIRAKVSSGTYVRTLFSDIARDLGTLGTLVSLVREKIGEISYKDSLPLTIFSKHDVSKDLLYSQLQVDDVLPFDRVYLGENRFKAFKNGLPILDFEVASLEKKAISDYFWIYREGEIVPTGLATHIENRYHPKINFS